MFCSGLQDSLCKWISFQRLEYRGQIGFLHYFWWSEKWKSTLNDETGEILISIIAYPLMSVSVAARLRKSGGRPGWEKLTNWNREIICIGRPNEVQWIVCLHTRKRGRHDLANYAGLSTSTIGQSCRSKGAINSRPTVYRVHRLAYSKFLANKPLMHNRAIYADFNR